MEFLASQQFKLSQRMANEHGEMQMIQRAQVGTIEQEDERALGKISRMRAADACHIGIQFPLLNMAFVEVHGAKWSQGHGYKEQAREEGREVRTTVARRGSQKDRRLRATNADSSPRRASSHGISVPQRGTRRLGQHGSKTTKSGGYRRNRNRAAA